MNTLKLKAYAKINIALNITGKRDDGYHLLEMINDEVDIYDTLSFSKRKEREIILRDKSGVEPSSNIVYKVAVAMFRDFSLEGGLEINLEKNIPMGAGLGGGSSDCATTIMAINQMYDLGLSKQEMADIGLRFGADVPYFIYGGAAVVSGIGEVVEPFYYEPFFKLFIIKPKLSCNTAEIFSNYEFKKTDFDIEKLKNTLINKDFDNISQNLTNSLVNVVIKLYNDIGGIIFSLNELGLNTVFMTGSGSCLVVLYKDDMSILEHLEDLKENEHIDRVFLSRIVRK